MTSNASIEKENEGDNIYPRDTCPETYSMGQNMTRHMQDQYVCATCNKSFKLKKQLAVHSVTHKNKYQCDFCPKRFKSKQGMFGHIQIHGSTRNHRCKICHRDFKWRCVMLCHLETHADNASKHVTTRPIDEVGNEMEHVCEICDKKFRTMQSVVGHMQIHASTKSYKCDICEKTFKWKRTRLYHLKTHADKNIVKKRNDHCKTSHNSLKHDPTQKSCLDGFNSSTNLKDHRDKDGCETYPDDEDNDSENRRESDGISKNFKAHPNEYEICHKRFKTRKGLFNETRAQKTDDRVSPQREACLMTTQVNEEKTIDETTSVQLWSYKFEKAASETGTTRELILKESSAIEEDMKYDNAFDEAMEINFSKNRNSDASYVEVKAEAPEIFDLQQILKREVKNDEHLPNVFLAKTEETVITSLNDIDPMNQQSSITKIPQQAGYLEDFFWSIMNQISDYANERSKIVDTDDTKSEPDFY